ncbi:MAG: PH domain-containing protein [Patescibacteria group bacterium]
MPNLLHKVSSIRIFTGEIHPTTLYIHEEYMVYVKRGIIKRNEATISYNHVSQVYLRNGYFFSSIEVINTGGVENIEVKWLPKKEAEKAKRLIDHKVFHTHSNLKPNQIGSITSLVGNPNELRNKNGSADFEKKVARLKELKLKGVISQREFEKQRKEMIKSI